MKKNIFLLVCVTIIFTLSFFCTKKEQTKTGETSMKGSLKELVDFCKNKTEAVILGEESGPNLVILPDRGAKIIGMSTNGLQSENLLWIPQAMLTDSFWVDRKWNIGGARSWLSPEDQFYLDEKDVWFVPSQMDPGNYKKENTTKDNIKCSNTFEIKNKAGNNYKIKFSRDITILKDIPENLKENTGAFKYAGFKFTHELENLSTGIIGKDIPFAGLWSLIQLKADGTLIIPIEKVKDPRGENYRNYFNIFTPDRISPKEDHITVKFDGKFRGKLGIAPWAAKNKLAYILRGNDGNGILFLKEFTVDAAGTYLDKPWGKPSPYGDAVQIYNDDGKMGGFCEMECHAPSKELKQGEKISQTIIFSTFSGKITELQKYIENILKLDHKDINYY